MNEKDNVGVFDTAIRAVIACFLLAFAAEQAFSTPVTLLVIAVATGLWLSCATGVCLIYKVLGIDTYHLKH